MLKEEFGEINHRNPKELNNGSPRLSVYLRALRFDKSVVTRAELSRSSDFKQGSNATY